MTTFLTREDVLSLSGRELDAAVAERVMGWKWQEHGSGGTRRRLLWSPDGKCGCRRWENDGQEEILDDLPHYSTDIAAAWEVVEWMHEFGVQMWAGYDSDGNPFAAYNDGDCHPYLSADTVPQAICRLALMAVSERSEATDGGDGGQLHRRRVRGGAVSGGGESG